MEEIELDVEAVVSMHVDEKIGRQYSYNAATGHTNDSFLTTMRKMELHMKIQVKDNRRVVVREEFCIEKLSATTVLSFFKTWKQARLSGPCQRRGTWCREVKIKQRKEKITKKNKRNLDFLEKQQCFAHFH